MLQQRAGMRMVESMTKSQMTEADSTMTSYICVAALHYAPQSVHVIMKHCGSTLCCVCYSDVTFGSTATSVRLLCNGLVDEKRLQALPTATWFNAHKCP